MDKREKVAKAIAKSDGHDWDTCSQSQREEYLDNADAAIAALEPMDKPRVKPRVKPLVWDLWDGGMIAAKTASGTYNLSQNLRLCLPNGSYRHYGTEETAKAAAQADYEARILAALE